MSRAHERLGLPQKYLEGWTNFFAMRQALIRWTPTARDADRRIHSENFLLSRDSGGWRLSGLIDFGDVMTGWGEYDLLGPSAS